MLVRIALRNVFRHAARTAMTLAAIVFGVAGLIVSGGFIEDVYVQLGEAIVHSQTGHIQVFRRGYLEQGTRHPQKFLIETAPELTTDLARIERVKLATARLNFSGLLNNGQRDLPIIGEGVEPGKEASFATHVRVTQGRLLADTDGFGMMVGAGVAQSLGLSPGERVTLVANTADGALNTVDLELVGVFESFSREFDARAIRIPLTAAQELLGTAGANVVVIALHDTKDTDAVHAEVAAQLDAQELEARHWRQLSDFYDKTVQLYERQFGVLQFIILLMVLLSVANTVNMSAFERLGEFGTMRALGNTRGQIFRLILIENAMLGVIGATLGISAGMLLAVIISAIGIPMPPPPNANLGYTAYIRMDAITVLTAFAIGCTAAALAAIFPARKASAMPVVDALRQYQ